MRTLTPRLVAISLGGLAADQQIQDLALPRREEREPLHVGRARRRQLAGALVHRERVAWSERENRNLSHIRAGCAM